MLKIKRYKIIAVLVFLVLNFFTIVVNINSASSIQREQILTENAIKIENAKLDTNKELIESQILEDVKRKKLSSEDEKVNPSEIINIRDLEVRKSI